MGFFEKQIHNRELSPANNAIKFVPAFGLHLTPFSGRRLLLALNHGDLAGPPPQQVLYSKGDLQRRILCLLLEKDLEEVLTPATTVVKQLRSTIVLTLCLHVRGAAKRSTPT